MCRYSYNHLFNYIPVRFRASEEDKKARAIVYDFKDGHCSDSVKNEFVREINKLGRDKLVCFIPASSTERTVVRFSSLASYINAHSVNHSSMTAITRSADSQPGYLNGKSSNPTKDFVINQAEVQGESIILIDDVITRGRTFEDTADKLMEAGAVSVVGLFLAKTVYPIN